MIIDWLKANSNVITDWLIAIGTILLFLAAVFQDKIRAWLTRPKLSASIDVAPPDCHKTVLKSFDRQGHVIDAADCYYLRLRVGNSGNQRAEMVEVFASELSKRQVDGSFKRMDSFLPMNLVWSHIRRPFLDAISPGMEKLCDLGHIVEPEKRPRFGMEDNPQLGVPADQTIFSFDVATKSFTMSHLIPPGKYRLLLLIAAANTKPVSKTLEIVVTGNWYDDESRMLGEGIGIRML